MLGLTQAADMAIDRYIVGRIRKDSSAFLPLSQFIRAVVACIATQQAVRAEHPQVADAADCWTGNTFGSVILGFCALAPPLLGLIQDDIDLAHLEAGQLDVEFEIDEALQLDG